MSLQLTPVDTVNVVDSARVALSSLAQEIASDPDKFVHNLIEEGINFGLKVLAALVIYAVGAWIIRRVKHFLSRLFLRKNTEGTLASFVTSLVTITMTAILIIITISTLGINTTSIAALLAAGGMAVGMALSGTVQNFAGGIMILVFKPFKVGDYIEAQGFSGIVADVNIFSTKLRTYDNRTIVLPNGALSNGNINNIFDKPFNRLEWKVNLEYGVDSAKAKEAMMALLKADARILNSGTEGVGDPCVLLNSLKDSSVEYLMRGWVKTEDYWSVQADMNEAIYTNLPKQGFGFPFPQLDIHNRS